jgi:hypothetical protein
MSEVARGKNVSDRRHAARGAAACRLHQQGRQVTTQLETCQLGTWRAAVTSIAFNRPFPSGNSGRVRVVLVWRGVIVRGIAGTLMVLFAAGYWASIVELPDGFAAVNAHAPSQAEGWRRTAHGWEHATSWRRSDAPSPAGGVWAVHPLAVATLQTLVALFALLLTDGARGTRRDRIRRRRATCATPHTPASAGIGNETPAPPARPRTRWRREVSPTAADAEGRR